MVKLKHLKGKFPEKKVIRSYLTSKEYKLQCRFYNEGQDSYAELEVGCDTDKLQEVIIGWHRKNAGFLLDPNWKSETFGQGLAS